MKSTLAKAGASLATAMGMALPAAVLAQEVELSDTAAAGIGIGLIVIWGLVMLVTLGLFIFWIMMFMDLLKREWPDKTTWMIVMLVSLFVGLWWLAAIIYYIVIKKKNVGTKKGGTPSTPSTPSSPAGPAPTV